MILTRDNARRKTANLLFFCNEKSRGRTAEFSVKVDVGKCVDQTTNLFLQRSQKWPIASRWKPCRNNSSRLLYRLVSLKIDILRTSIEPFLKLTANQYSNLRDEVKNIAIQETLSKMSPSKQTLID